MRLLGLTNFYAPLGYGYGGAAGDVMEALAARGHECTVLCADGGPGDGVTVRTGLGHVPGAWRRPLAGLRAEAASQRMVRQAIGESVDAALAFHLRGVGKGSLRLLHDAKIPVVYVLGDLWVVYERPGALLAAGLWARLDSLPAYRALRSAAGRAAGAGHLELRPPPIAERGRVAFASAWLRDAYAAAGFRPQDGRVIPNGIRLGQFAGPERAPLRAPLDILFAGRLDPTKGADLAIDAVARIDGARLTIAGDGERDVVVALAERARRNGASDRVDFAGALPRDAVARLMRDADVFLMPARTPDAFGLVYVEAMAAGAVVVGTARGGAAEICRDGVNALVVPEDAAAIATALARLSDDPALAARLAAAGRETATNYSLGGMVDRIEALVAS